MQTAYETVFILDPGSAEDQVNSVVEKYSGVITRGGGSVNDVDRMEPRRLAYEIKDRRQNAYFREGIYVVVNFTADHATKDELDRIFRISDDTLRYIIIKQDKKADLTPSRTRAANIERRERESAARAAASAAAAETSEEAPITDLGASGETAEETAPEATAAPAPEAAAPVTEENTVSESADAETTEEAEDAGSPD